MKYIRYINVLGYWLIDRMLDLIAYLLALSIYWRTRLLLRLHRHIKRNERMKEQDKMEEELWKNLYP